MVHWIFLVVAFTAGAWFGFFMTACFIVAGRSDAPPPPSYTDIEWVKEYPDNEKGD